MRKIFAVFATVVFIGVIFYSPVVKAAETTTGFDALFPAQTIPGTDVTIENNLNDVGTVRTELAVWENDLGASSTDGSYVGPIFESSLFEVDYEPYLEDDTIDFSGQVFREFVVKTVPLSARDDVGLNLSSTNWEWPFSLWPRHFDDSSDYIETFTSYFPIAEKRSIVSLAMNVTFTNRMILSGATDFWTKIPIKSSCINFEELRPTLSIFKLTSAYDSSKLWLDGGYAIVYEPYPKRTVFDASGNISVIDTDEGEIRQEYSHTSMLRSSYDGNEAQIIQYITDEYVVNGNLYCNVRGTIEPNVEYLFVFSAILSSKPTVYLTEEDICSNTRASTIQVTDIDFPSVSKYTKYESGIETTGFHNFVYVESEPSGTEFVNETMELPVDLGFSFVFKNGRGDWGMFGHKYHFEENEGFKFYKELEKPTTDKFISVMIPFISNDWIDVEITVKLLPTFFISNKFEPRGVLGRNITSYRYFNESSREFGYTYTNNWHSSDMTYTDYILFTVPYKIDASAINQNYPLWVEVFVTFNRPADVTFMFSTLSDSAYDEYILDDVFYGVHDNAIFPKLTTDPDERNFVNYSTRGNLFYIIRDTILKPMGTHVFREKEDYYDYEYNNNWQYYYENYIRMPSQFDNLEISHYELFASVQITDGIWHELVTSPDGYQYATHFFERRIAIGVVDLWIDTTNNESAEKVSWYDEGTGLWGQAWESLKKLDIISAVKYAIQGGISLLWNGLKAFVGVIIGVFKTVWDGLVGLGKFIYSIISSFIGTVLSIIGDIVDAAERILSVVLYIIAILIFMYVVSWGGRLIYLSRMYV